MPRQIDNKLWDLRVVFSPTTNVCCCCLSKIGQWWLWWLWNSNNDGKREIPVNINNDNNNRNSKETEPKFLKIMWMNGWLLSENRLFSFVLFYFIHYFNTNVDIVFEKNTAKNINYFVFLFLFFFIFGKIKIFFCFVVVVCLVVFILLKFHCFSLFIIRTQNIDSKTSSYNN